MSNAIYTHNISRIRYNGEWIDVDADLQEFISFDAFEVIDFPSVAQPEQVGCKDFDEVFLKDRKYSNVYQYELTSMLEEGDRPLCLRFPAADGYIHLIPIGKIEGIQYKPGV